jgi:hypothetical protein
VSEDRQEGGCRCGAVRFAVSGDPLATFACHCKGCQRMSASAFSLTSLYPDERFEMLQGNTVLGGLKGETRHHFCAACMTWMFTRAEALGPFVNIRSTMLDDASRQRPFVDMYLAEGFAWAHSGAERGYQTAPQESEFGELMTAYAAWDGKVMQ